ncbi:MAG: nicotinate (nicotinamide) nucleotide adenylyltransferase [Proteobacteria bacterium]|nr:nicotinate (nicotinamide) nucleotide adenylyltransferase [Pseudomonadota bacterium]
METFLQFDWILFGGTFDPPHLGHMDIVRSILDEYLSAEIVVVPSFSPPIGKGIVKNVSSSFSDRVAMCVLAFDQWERVQISALEEDIETPSYTINTLRSFKSEHNLDSVAWVMGADQWESFCHWNNPIGILEISSVIVIPRASMTHSDLLQNIVATCKALGVYKGIDEVSNCVQLTTGQTVVLLKNRPTNVSSTEFRNEMRLNPQFDGSTYVVPQVFEYIIDAGLYEIETT